MNRGDEAERREEGKEGKSGHWTGIKQERKK